MQGYCAMPCAGLKAAGAEQRKHITHQRGTGRRPCHTEMHSWGDSKCSYGCAVTLLCAPARVGTVKRPGAGLKAADDTM